MWEFHYIYLTSSRWSALKPSSNLRLTCLKKFLSGKHKAILPYIKTQAILLHLATLLYSVDAPRLLLSTGY
ncbi:hypothetical protein I7I48_04650 [Histoplasma ohiense]|nr:hypothetical protein I7I48_04650 [Histoplasma ohiense (nom. inval.)]